MIRRTISKIRLFIFLLTYLFIITVFADKQRIRICMKDFDMSGSIINVGIKYNNLLKEYFEEKVKNNEKLKNYIIDILYYPYKHVDHNGQSVALQLMKDLSDRLPKKEYDLVILDERILFNEMARIESRMVYKGVKYRHPSLDLYHDLSKYIKKEDLEFHDPKILSGGMYKDKIIGIPFEFDFNVFYYREKELDLKAYNDFQLLLENMEKNTWNDFVEQMEKNSQPCKISFGDDNNLLDFFIEYTSNHYNLSQEYDPNLMKLFYNETSYTFFENHRSVENYFYRNKDYAYSVFVTLDELFNMFMYNNSTFFRGKASYNYIFSNSESLKNYTFHFTLPPKYQSATTYSYILANKFSEIEPEILAEVALILTSKEAQLLRSNSFGKIPTFDFSKKDLDTDLQDYCNKNKVICEAMEKMKKLYIRDIFKSDTLVPFFEIIWNVPLRFKNFFYDGDIDYIRTIFIHMNEFLTDNLGVYGVLSIILIILTILFFIFVIFMTYKLRNHPYIKVISPTFCNLIVIGCIFNLIKVIKFIPPYSETKIKIFLILGTLGTNLIYIPMFVVSYRIYHILKKRSLKSSSLTDKQLLIGVFFIISLSLIYHLTIVFTCKFNYESTESIIYARIPVGYYTNFDTLNSIYQGYFMFIVCY